MIHPILSPHKGGDVLRRNTAQKMAIEKVFCNHQRPLSIDDVLTYGRAFVETLNKATVYRNVKMLLDDGWLTRVMHPTMGTLYERANQEHHHHFLCRSCHRAFDLPGCAIDKEHVVPDGFVVEDHDLFLFGICPFCKGAQKKDETE